MGWADYKSDLLSPTFQVDEVLNKYFHSGQSAAFAGANPNEEPRFKAAVAGAVTQTIGIKCHPMQLVLCGSAHLGFSPVPEKFVRMFNCEDSDMDIAVVSPELFDAWWSELQECERLVDGVRHRIAEDLLWGFIDPSKVRGFTGLGKSWWKLFGGFKTDRARGVRGRVYRTHWSMQNYHRHAIVRGRERLRGMRTS